MPSPPFLGTRWRAARALADRGRANPERAYQPSAAFGSCSSSRALSPAFSDSYVLSRRDTPAVVARRVVAHDTYSHLNQTHISRGWTLSGLPSSSQQTALTSRIPSVHGRMCIFRPVPMLQHVSSTQSQSRPADDSGRFLQLADSSPFAIANPSSHCLHYLWSLMSLVHERIATLINPSMCWMAVARHSRTGVHVTLAG